MNCSVKKTVVLTAIFFIVWNLFDYYLDVVVMGGTCTWTLANVVMPVMMALLFGCFEQPVGKRTV